MRQNSAQQLLANLGIVGAVVRGSVWQAVDVVSDERGLESVQKRREIVGLVLAI
jgi:hypothetical protein